MPPTVSSWGSCGHQSDPPCCQRGSMEPCLIISPKMLFWQTSKPRDAEISSVTQIQRVGVHLQRLQLHCFSLCFNFMQIRCYYNYNVIKKAQSCSSYVIISAAQPSEVAAEEELSCDTERQPLSPLQLSPHIRCLVFPRGDITRFKPARWAHLLSYWANIQNKKYVDTWTNCLSGSKCLVHMLAMQKTLLTVHLLFKVLSKSGSFLCLYI